MKCEAWVNPAKFSKKFNRPTARAVIGLDTFDWNWWCDPKHSNAKQAAKFVALRLAAVLCGGPIKVDLYVSGGGDGEYYDDTELNIDYVCDWCNSPTKPANLPKDIEELQVDLQEMADSRTSSLNEAACPHCHGERSLGDCEVTRQLFAREGSSR